VLVRSVWRAGVEPARGKRSSDRGPPRASDVIEEALSLGSHPFAAIIGARLAEAALNR
jgi:hypothetical protein